MCNHLTRTGGDDHFSVDTITGEVIIKDRYKHTEGQVFKLAVSARCEGVVYQRGSTNTEVCVCVCVCVCVWVVNY